MHTKASHNTSAKLNNGQHSHGMFHSYAFSSPRRSDRFGHHKLSFTHLSADSHFLPPQTRLKKQNPKHVFQTSPKVSFTNDCVIKSFDIMCNTEIDEN